MALVTGAASGIGRACAEALLGEGSAVEGVDVAPTIETAFGRRGLGRLQAHVIDREALARAL